MNGPEQPQGGDEGEVIEVETERVDAVIDAREVLQAIREEAGARAAGMAASESGADDGRTLARIGELAEELARELDRLERR